MRTTFDNILRMIMILVDKCINLKHRNKLPLTFMWNLIEV